MAIDDSLELDNFETLTRETIPRPGEIPKIPGFDVYGESIPIRGPVGGDHIIYLDFKNRYDLEEEIKKVSQDDRFTPQTRERIINNIHSLKTKAGLLIADVSGHYLTDFAFASRLHDSFLIGVLYEIEDRGDVTPNLFRKLNTRLYNSSSFDKYITMIYGEISESGAFKFISAGHPFPLIYSRKQERLLPAAVSGMEPSPPLAAFPSSGPDLERNMFRSGFSSRFKVNHLTITRPGDILLLYTDGVTEHTNSEGQYFYDSESGGELEKAIHRNRDLSSKELFSKIKESLMDFSEPQDDVSYILVKKVE
ncbi:PP2C family protein-serine/threonine phosphatase [Acidobacteriota bacterium]